MGLLDEDAFDSALAEDADGALVLLAALTGATDERLREAARRLAARVVLDVTRAGPARATGVGRIERRPADRAEGDLDLDASLEPLQLARAGGTAPPLDELRVSTWGRPSTALCLVVDRSGSMNGERLATAALAAAASSWRAGEDYSVVAFSWMRWWSRAKTASAGPRRWPKTCFASAVMARPTWPSRCARRGGNWSAPGPSAR